MGEHNPRKMQGSDDYRFEGAAGTLDDADLAFERRSESLPSETFLARRYQERSTFRRMVPELIEPEAVDPAIRQPGGVSPRELAVHLLVRPLLHRWLRHRGSSGM